MSNQPDKSTNARFHISDELTPEQLLTLEEIERIAELDPEITERLARALDRLQLTQPYQSVSRSTPSAANPMPQVHLTEVERVARDKIISQELDSLLALAGQLVQKFSKTTRESQPDKHFRDQLRGQLFPQNK